MVWGTTSDPEEHAARSRAASAAMGGAPLYEQEEVFRRDVIRRALHAHNGNRSAAARALGIQRTYLQRLMRRLGVQDYRAKRDGSVSLAER